MMQIEEQFKKAEEQNATMCDIAYALKLFEINAKNFKQKELGKQFLPFVQMFDVPKMQPDSQAFNFDLISKKKLHLFTARFICICDGFLQTQTVHAKKEFIKKLIMLSKEVFCC